MQSQCARNELTGQLKLHFNTGLFAMILEGIHH